jgi:hypothetical protein
MVFGLEIGIMDHFNTQLVSAVMAACACLLEICCLAVNVVSSVSSVSRLLPNNDSTCYNIMEALSILGNLSFHASSSFSSYSSSAFKKLSVMESEVSSFYPQKLTSQISFTNS